GRRTGPAARSWREGFRWSSVRSRASWTCRTYGTVGAVGTLPGAGAETRRRLVRGLPVTVPDRALRRLRGGQVRDVLALEAHRHKDVAELVQVHAVQELGSEVHREVGAELLHLADQRRTIQRRHQADQFLNLV